MEMEMERKANFVCATKGVFFFFTLSRTVFPCQGFVFYRQSKMGLKNGSSWVFPFFTFPPSPRSPPLSLHLVETIGNEDNMDDNSLVCFKYSRGLALY